MVRKSSSFDISTRFLVIIGILAFAIIVGTIVGSTYTSNEGFTGTMDNKTLVYLYMENCRFCKDFNNTWGQIENEAKQTKKFKTVKYDLNKTEEGKKIATENNISYAPALLLQMNDKTIVYNENTRNKDEIISWVNGK
jgi:Thioredoxin